MQIISNGTHGYIPINKNAQTTYRKFFTSNGWNLEEIVMSSSTNLILFAHIQDPLIRYSKGMAELGYHKGTANSKNNFFFQRIFWDNHLLPINILLGDFADKTHFIPIDHSISCNELTNNYFKYHDIDLEITDNDNKNISDKKKRQYQQEIDVLFKELFNKDMRGYFNRLYQKDTVYHHEALQKATLGNYKSRPLPWWERWS